MLGAFRYLLEQALGVHEPTRGDGACPSEEVVAKQCQGETCRTSPITVREVSAERALTGLDARLAGPTPRRRLADQLQVLRCQLCRIDGHEHVVRLAPRSPRRCLPAELHEFVDRPRIGHETEILKDVRLDDNRAASTVIVWSTHRAVSQGSWAPSREAALACASVRECHMRLSPLLLSRRLARCAHE